MQAVDLDLRAMGVSLETYSSDAHAIAYPDPQDLPTCPEPTPDDRYADKKDSLNDLQIKIFKDVTEWAEMPRGQRDGLRVFRVEADAGAGKTFTANIVTNFLRARGHRVMCSAYTAKAATNYRGGSTCHRVFNLNVCAEGEVPKADLCASGCSKPGKAGALIYAADVVIVDEITMMRASELDAIVDALQRLQFTGALLLLGNNAQLACVIEHATTADVLQHHVTSSRTYHARGLTRHYRLKTNVRMANDMAFYNACTDIGYGRLAPLGEISATGMHQIRLDHTMFPVEGYDDSNPERARASLERVRRFAHPHMFDAAPLYELATDGATNVIICPTRAVEKAHNAFFLGLLGACRSFASYF